MRANVVLGLLDGLNVALLALGLVLVFKAGRFINFAQAQLGVVGALVLGKLGIDYGWSWWFAFPVAVLLGGAIGAASELLVVRPLRDRNRLTLLIATIGLSQVLTAVALFKWLGPDPLELAAQGYPLPLHTTFFIDELPVGGQHVMIAVLVPAIAVGLTLLLRYTLLGKTIRAAASNPDAAGLAGIDVHRVSAITWVIAGALSAVSAILAAPNQVEFDPDTLGPTLLFRALGAAALAGFSSLPQAFAAALGLGVVEGVALNLTGSGGTALGMVFVVILVGLLVRSSRARTAVNNSDRLEVTERPIQVPPLIETRLIARRHRGLLIIAGIGIGLLAPLLPPFREPAEIFVLTLTLAFALVGMSLVALTGWAGQVSLGQFAFLGVGAFMAMRLSENGWSFPVIVILSGSVGALVALAVGLPGLRQSALTLAVTSLGLAVAGPNWIFRQSWFAPPGASQVTAYRVPGFGDLSSHRALYYSGLVLLVISGLALSALRRSGPGRLLIASRDNEEQLASLGVSTTAVRLSVFAISGFVSASAGVIWAAARGSVAVSQLSPHQSLLMLSMVVIGGLTSLPGAVLGAVLLFGLPTLASDFIQSIFSSTVQFQLALGGLGLIATQITYPSGIAGSLRHGFERLLRRLAREVEAANLAPPDTDHRGNGVAPLLSVRGVSVRFGGITAVDAVDLDVRPREIVGLIGANGAGKTTLVNAICGVVRTETGSIRMNGTELVGLGAEYRSHYGIGRSFQSARLFPGLTVRETLQVAMHRTARVGFFAALIAAPWVAYTERQTRARADELIERFGLRPYAEVPISQLSTGTRRICDLATQVATSPDLLVLDEPTAGVAQREAEMFGPLLRQIADELHCAILIIEHDMPLMLSVADRIYCLEAGAVLVTGDPDTVRNDPAVIASYLGTDEAAIERSGPRADAGVRHNGASSPPPRVRPGAQRARRRPLVADPNQRPSPLEVGAPSRPNNAPATTKTTTISDPEREAK